MNALFGNQKKPGFKPQQPKIRVEKVLSAPKLAPLPSAVVKKSSATSTALQPNKKKSIHNVPVRSITSVSAQSSRAGSSDTSDTLKVRKRKATRQISPVHQRLESDSSDDGEDSAFEFSVGGYEGKENKRRREIDRNRKVGCRELTDRDAAMTHQADIEITEFAKSGVPEDVVRLRFQYPNAVQRERLVTRHIGRRTKLTRI